MKVLVTGRLPQEVIALIKKEHEVEVNEEDRPMERERLLRSVGNKEGLLCMITDRVDEQLLDRAPRLRMVANYGVGFDNIDVRAATQRGILVSNTPGVLTHATADITFTLILATARRVVEGDRSVSLSGVGVYVKGDPGRNVEIDVPEIYELDGNKMRIRPDRRKIRLDNRGRGRFKLNVDLKLENTRAYRRMTDKLSVKVRYVD